MRMASSAKLLVALLLTVGVWSARAAPEVATTAATDVVRYVCTCSKLAECSNHQLTCRKLRHFRNVNTTLVVGGNVTDIAPTKAPTRVDTMPEGTADDEHHSSMAIFFVLIVIGNANDV